VLWIILIVVTVLLLVSSLLSSLIALLFRRRRKKQKQVGPKTPKDKKESKKKSKKERKQEMKIAQLENLDAGAQKFFIEAPVANQEPQAPPNAKVNGEDPDDPALKILFKDKKKEAA